VKSCAIKDALGSGSLYLLPDPSASLMFLRELSNNRLDLTYKSESCNTCLSLVALLIPLPAAKSNSCCIEHFGFSQDSLEN
jgi:hypothetical protein